MIKDQMNFDGPVFAWLILALLPFALPVLLGFILKQLLHVQAGLLPLIALIIIAVGSAYGLAAYLDAAGKPIKGEVLAKRESLVYHVDGSWNRKMAADVSYRPSDSAQPIVKTLDLLPARFDEINQGDFIDLRYPASPDSFRILRLEDQTTLSQVWYWINNQPFLFFFLLGLLFVLSVWFVFRTSLPTVFFLSAFITIGSWWLAAVGIPLWEQTSTLFGSLNSVNGTVKEVHPPYLGTGIQHWISTTLYWPSDLILLDIIPVGHPQPILSVDQVDLGSSNLRPGQSVTVEYSAANPRLSIVPDASRTYLWKNALLSTTLTLLAMFGVARFAYSTRDKTQQRSDTRPPRPRFSVPT